MFDKTPRKHDIPRHYYEFCTIKAMRSVRVMLHPCPAHFKTATTCYENFKTFKILVAFPRHATSWEDLCTTTADKGRVLYEFTKKVGGAKLVGSTRV